VQVGRGVGVVAGPGIGPERPPVVCRRAAGRNIEHGDTAEGRATGWWERAADRGSDVRPKGPAETS